MPDAHQTQFLLKQFPEIKCYHIFNGYNFRYEYCEKKNIFNIILLFLQLPPYAPFTQAPPPDRLRLLSMGSIR